MRSFSATKLAGSLLTALDETPAKDHAAVIRAFVRMLGRKHWLKHAERIVAAVIVAQDAREGRVAVMLTTARPLTHVEALKKELARALGADVRMDTAVDESLIGGATVQYGDTRLDASVRRSLDQLKSRFAN